jgi:hypothetical protein
MAGNKFIDQKGRCQNDNACGNKEPERFMGQFHDKQQPSWSDNLFYHTSQVQPTGQQGYGVQKA